MLRFKAFSGHCLRYDLRRRKTSILVLYTVLYTRTYRTKKPKRASTESGGVLVIRDNCLLSEAHRDYDVITGPSF